MLGLTAPVKQIGKDMELNARAKRINVVIAHSLQNSPQKREEILEALKKEANDDLMKLLNETNSLKFAEQLAIEYSEKAANELQSLKLTKAKIILETIPKIIATRKR